MPEHWSYCCWMAAPRMPAFRGRAHERHALDGLLDSVRGGQSAVLVIRGAAGIGKTALLHYCARQAAGCRVAQFAGVESELELPFAALHQLCGPMLADLETLPEPQQDAVRVAFGLSTGSAPDRFLVGLAILSLLAEVAAKRPLVCLIDDAQWLDVPSAQVLEFVGRRLLAESVLLLFAVRETTERQPFRALPTMTVGGLTDSDARAFLTAAVPGHLDEQVRDRLVAETDGNPLALLELVGAMSSAELAGGFPVPPAATLSGHLHDHYLRRVRALPEPTQRLMLLAAADPTGDATLVWRAARVLGIGPQEATGAASEQLLDIGARVRFRHPLVRSAAYAAGSSQDRRSVHLALAEATDIHADPERRVWHLAAAATGPDEYVAAELERTAGRAQARAGLAGAAAFLERSVALTAAPERRADRALAAAHANLHAGVFDAALSLLAEAEATAVDDLQRARVEQLRGQVDRVSSSGREASVRLLRAARTLESLDVRLARDTYLDALFASLVAGRLAEPGGHVLEVATAARSVRPPGTRPTAVRPVARRSGDDDHRRPCGGSADPATGGGCVPRRSAFRRGPAQGRPAQLGSGPRTLGRRQLGRVEHPASRVRSRIGSTCPAVRRTQRPPGDGHLPRRLRRGDLAGRGGERGQGGDRGSKGLLRGPPARRVPGATSRSVGAHRHGHQRCDRPRRGTRSPSRQLGDGDPVQRPRPLRGGVARGGTGGRRDVRAVRRGVRTPGADRGRRAQRTAATRGRRAAPTVDDDENRGCRLGVGPRGTLASAAERR